MEWQPIKTAPRAKIQQYRDHGFLLSRVIDNNVKSFCSFSENESVLLYGRPFFEQDQSLGSPRCFVGFWSEMNDRWEEQMQGVSDDAIEKYEIIPTHWKLLPPPPK